MLLVAVYATSTFAQDVTGTIDEYYPQGAKWTELRLDTTKFDSWYSEDGVGGWKANFEEVNFYVEGDTLVDNITLNMVFKDTEEQKHLKAFFLTMKNKKVFVGAHVGRHVYVGEGYDFENWTIGESVQSLDLYMSNVFTGGNIYEYHNPIKEIKKANFGGGGELEFFEGRFVRSRAYVRDCGDYKLIRGIGMTASKERDCLFCLASIPYIDMYNVPYMPEYQTEAEKKHYRSILVHFERNGEVLYDLWPNEKGELVTRLPSVRETDRDNTSVYDLQGRKVEGKPSRGLYIIGGKKRAVK